MYAETINVATDPKSWGLLPEVSPIFDPEFLKYYLVCWGKVYYLHQRFIHIMLLI